MNSEITTENSEQMSKWVLAVLLLLTFFYFGWFFASSSTAEEIHETASHLAVDDHPAEKLDDHKDEIPHEADAEHHLEVPPPAIYSVIPFLLLLGAIALLPLSHKTEHWWEHNINRFKVAAGLGFLTLLYYAFLYDHPVADHFAHGHTEAGISASVTVLKNAILVEYIPFIALLFSLYVISGGIHLRGTLVGKPN